MLLVAYAGERRRENQVHVECGGAEKALRDYIILLAYTAERRGDQELRGCSPGAHVRVAA